MKRFLLAFATMAVLFITSLQSFSQTVTITQPNQLTAVVSGSTTICSGGSATITVVLSGGTASWTVSYPEGSRTVGGADPYTFQFNTGVLTTTTTYNAGNITVTDSHSCTSSISGSAVVSVNQLPTATISGTTTVCQNGTNPLITFTGSNGTAPYTFTYTLNGTTLTATTSGSNTSVTVSQSTGTVGVYNYILLSVKDASSTACSNAVTDQSAVVTVNDLPSAPTAGNVTVCYDGSVHTGTATAGSGETIVWYTASTGGSVTVAPSGTASETYTAYAGSKNTASGCESSSRTLVTVTIYGLPAAPTAGNVTVCYDGSVHTGTATAGSGETIVWYTAATGNTLASVPSGTEAGTYAAYAAAKSAAGCESANRTLVTVTINSTPKGFNDAVTLDCSGTFIYNLQDNVNNTSKGGNAVSSSFTWTVSSNSDVLGASSSVSPQTSINQTLYNLSNTTQTVTYTVTPKATGAGTCEGNPFTVTVTVPVCSSISIVKVADKASVSKAGDVITYTIAVSNTGNANQTNVKVTDPFISASALTNPVKTGGNTDDILERDETWTYVGTYVVTQTDLDNYGNPTFSSGKIINTVSIVTSELPTAKTATSVVTINKTSTYTLVKSITGGSTYAAVGDVLSYDIAVTNTGNTTLSNLKVTDTKAVIASGNPIVSLSPGTTVTLTASHAVTQSDIDAGQHTNFVTGTATDSQGTTVTDTGNTVTSTVTAHPSYTLVKSITGGSSYSSTSDVLTYEIAVTNTGNTTLSNLKVTDTKAVIASGNPIVSLSPGTTVTLTASHAVTQSDIDAGQYTNFVTGTATDSQGTTVTDTGNTVTSTVTAHPSYTLVKSITGGSSYSSTSDVLTYEIAVTNTGNTTLSNLKVTDTKAVIASGNPIASLSPGTTVTLTASHAVTQSDIDAGQYTNFVTGTATDSQGTTVTDTGNTVTSTVTAHPSYTLVKSITGGSTYSAVGDVLTYEIAVTNTGNTTLSNLKVTDTKAVIASGNPIVSLSPGSTVTLTASHAVTQSDIDAGQYTNFVTGTATDSQGTTVTDTGNTVTSTVTAHPSYTLVKSITGGSSYSSTSDVLTYEIAVTNTGNTTLSNLLVTDTKAVIASGNPIVSLSPGTTVTLTASHAVTQSDIDAGQYTNFVTGTATDSQGTTVTDTGNTVTSTVSAHPSYTLVKSITGGNTYSAVNDVLTYEIAVTNTGNTTLSNLKVTDTKAVIASGNPIVSLSPGSTVTLTASHAVTQDDIDAGQYTNFVTGTATDSQGTDVPETGNTVTSTVSAHPSYTLVKSITGGSSYSAVGDLLSYDIAVTNTGNTTLNNLFVSDTKAVISSGNPIVSLAPGTTVTLTASHSVTQDDIDAGEYTNFVTGTATDSQGTTVTDTGNTVTSTVTAHPSYTLVKSITGGNTYSAVNDLLTYDIAVTNTGNTTLSNLLVTDTKAVIASGNPIVSLSPGTTVTLTASHSVTQDDIDAGEYTNFVTGTATDSQGTDVPETGNTVTSTASQISDLTITKTVKESTYKHLGDILNYTIEVKNVGNVTLSNIALTDLNATITSTNPIIAFLLPGETVTVTALHVVTQADLDDGSILNTATATATDPNNATLTGTSNTVTTVETLTPILAVDDNNTSNPISGISGGIAINNVLSNDKLNNTSPILLSDVNLSQTSSTNSNVTLDPLTGAVNVASVTPSGTYTLTYTICEKLNPNNCSTATATVVVSNTIDAVNDTPVTVSTGGTTSSVIGNDTLNGTPAVIGADNGQVTLGSVTVPTGLTLNVDGTITVIPNTPSGTYTVVYSICENGAVPANCDTATATVVVSNTIDAVNDTPVTVSTGGTTSSVIGNDTLNGTPAVIGADNGQVTLGSVTVPTGLTLNVDGTITVIPNTPSGTYTVVYSICENGAVPANCDTATATVVVSNTIDAVNDTPVTVSTGGTTSSVIGNDTLNGTPAVIGADNGQVTLGSVTVPTGLTLNVDGTITVIPNTPSGTYTVVYSICENGAVPANCDTATATVVVSNTIDAVNDTPVTVSTGGTTSSVIGNDTLNGTPAVIGADNGQVTLGSVTVPTGLTLNVDGTITVIPNTPSGTYTVVYSICENGAVPANCDTATATVVVSNTIDAVNDTPVTVSTGGTTSSVIGNDTLNGTPAVIGADNGQVTLGSVTVPTGLTLNVDGTITVIPNTPSGTYTVVYSICENGAVPANCDTATATVVVSNTIDAVNDTPVTVSTGGTTSSVIGNDTLNGTPAVIGADNGQVTLGSVTVPTGLTLNVDGTITVIPNTPSGTYTVVYSICENGAVPANCDTATATVVVSNTIDAVNDTPVTVSTGGTTSSVIGNDTLNGTPAVIGADNGQVTLGSVTVPTGLTLNVDGTITVIPNTPSGTYTVVYSICENGAVPANCDTATATVVVSNTIDAVNDTPVTVSTGGTTSSVIGNDTLNGTPAVIGADNGQVTLGSVTVPTGLTLNVDGTITVIPNTPSGTYTVVYSICENGAVPANCDTATATVVVSNTIDAVNDTPVTVSTGGTTSSVIGNDTLNGTPAVIGADNGQVTLGSVTVPTGLTLNVDGTITVIPNTPSGTYTVVYSICENGAVPANCDTATATVVVSNTIDAVNDTPVTVSTGGTTSSVIGNDTLNGTPAVIGADNGQVTLGSVTVPTGLTLNVDGTITVIPNTPSGTYTVVYSICENGAVPANCDTATATVVVSNTIDAVNDTPVTVSTGGTTSSVIGNDTLNGTPAVIGADNGQVTLGSVTVPTGLTLNVDGTITVIPNTPSGTYTVVYSICENGAVPANCDTATATVVVSNTIDAVNDTPVTVSTGGTTSSVIGNDTLNGTPAVIGADNGQVTLGSVTVPTGLTLNVDGTITVIPNTPSGTYTVVYSICENGAVPANCDTATATVVVSNTIDAVNDTPVTVSTGGTTSSVIGNDTLNGTPAVIGADNGQVTLGSVTVPTGLTLNVDGTITVIPNTPSGTYTVVYSICENGAVPANCDTATATVVVSNTIDAVNDTPVTVSTGGTTSSVIGNDTLNGTPAVIGADNGQVTLGSVTVPTGLTLNVDGTITVIPNTPSGTYTVVYSICENGAVPANCDTATATVVVSNTIDAVNDTPVTVSTGGTTSSVIGNDTLNGTPAVIGADNGQVTLGSVTVPTGLTLNVDGTITVIPNTPSGTYTVVYSICENGAVPANCDTATATVVVSNTIDAVNDTPVTVSTGGTTSSVIGNDTLNGTPAVIGADNGQVTLGSVTVPTGLTLNVDGTITVIPNTPSGTYTVVYSICENGAVPANCDTATATVVVSNTIDAVNDTPVTVSTGGTTSSVIGNDTLNGTPAVIGADNGQVTLGSVTVPTGLTLNVDGTITVIPNTPSGTYTVVYSICENGAVPANCDTATATVVVSNTIDAVNDTPVTVSTGGTTSSVIGNDTLNGTPAVIGADNGQVTLGSVTVPTGLTLNVDGTITVIPNTPSGTYTVVYSICENGAVPANCDTATATVVVSNTIDAVNDTPVTVSTGGTTSSVIGNDTLNGTPAVIGADNGQVTLGSVTVPTGLTLNVDGTITVIPNTPSGTYTVVYSICENGAVPANCDTATATVVVSNTIDAVNDTPVTVSTGGTTSSVIGNDTLNGTPAVIGADNGQVTLGSVTVPTGLTLNVDGTITVIPNTPSGTYTVVYSICENGAVPANCDTATATVVVSNTIDAVNDTPVTVSTGGTTSSVIGNDTLNGTPAVIGADNGQVTLGSVTVPTGLTLNVDGTITVIPNTPSGTYTVVYSICENGAVPANCDTATATVVVSNTIDAVNDTPVTVSTGGTTSSVIGNDTLNGTPAVIGADNGQVTLGSVTVPTGLTLNVDGTITVIPNTPSGTYTVVYSICENGAVPANCDTATATVVVSNTIDAVNDTPVTVSTGGTTSSVIGNDTLNGTPAVIGADNGQVTLGSVTVPTGLTLNVDGTITVIPNTPSGTYTVVYSICENGAVPANCDTATATVVVSNTIDAVNDTPVTVSTGGTTSSVIGNDTLNGTPAVIGADNGQVTLGSVTVPTGLTLNVDGTITVIPNTPSGTYTVVYSICENGAVPANCDTATATVVVSNTIDAVNDTPVTVSTGGTTSSVIGNDTLNGTPAVIGADNGQVTLGSVTVPTGLTLNVDGTITVIPNTPSGTYTVVYSICENGAVPANCDTATATVVVSNTIDAVNDTPVTVSTGGTTSSVIGNDTLNGTPAVIGADNGQVTLGSVTVPTGLTLNVDGTITVIPNTPSGTYTVVYSICENGAVPANCDTATATVVVSNTIDAVNDTPVTVSTGGTTSSVIGNDTLNGTPAVIGADNGQVTLGSVTVPTGLTLNVDGTITVIPNTPSGTYTVVYSICENGAVPANCDTATATVVVSNTIDAVNDTPVTVSTGGTTSSVIGNDTLNGTPAVIGADNGQVTLGSVTVPTGLTLNVDGTITVIPNTPSGTYTVVYSICENGAVPANCDTATATVVVSNTIDAVNDTPVTVSTGGTTSSVIGNDTLNGTPAVIGADNGQVTLGSVTVPTGLTLNVDGTITVIPNTPSGTYTVVYSICENGAVPANCDTATATVVVSNTIDAVNDTPVTVSTGGTTSSVIGNDTLNGTPAVIGADNGQVTLGSVTVPTGLTLNVDGTITVIPNTPSGTYTVVYSICENGAVPANCDTATATVVVSNTIDAVNDTPVTVSTGGTTSSVIGNDTLNGTPAVIGADNGQVTLGSVTVPTGLTLNVDGTITVIPNTPSGTYTVVYSICENGAVPANCDTATATVVVSNTIDAVNDTPVTVSTGGTTSSVIGNDTLNGTPAVIGADNGQVTLGSVTVPTGLTLNVDGTITVIPNTPSGTYTVVYSICENGAVPANCDTATATVVVSNTIDAVNDTPVTVSTGGTTSSVIGNDTLNGTPAVIGADNGQVTLGSVTVPTGLTLNVDGTITVIPNTPSGTYTVVYSICENGAVPANCDTATATVVVSNTNPVANNDSKTTNEDTAVTISVLSNDTDIDGNTLTVMGTTTPLHGTAVINADYTITYTPDANYTGTDSFTYTISDGHGGTATATVTVIVIPVNDLPQAVNDNVATLKGSPVSGDVKINDMMSGDGGNQYSLNSSPTNGTVSFGVDGLFTYSPNANYIGVDTFTYKLCDVDGDCSVATVTITVKEVNIALLKTGTLVDANNDGIKGNAGDKINYSFVVTNTGTVTLTNVKVTDSKVTVSGGPVTLSAGSVDRTTFTAVYTITSSDVQVGSVSNQAKVEGTDPNGNKVTDLSDGSTLAGDNPTVTPLAGGAIALVKTGTLVDANNDGIKGNAGDKINYSFVVTNTGTVTLTNVTVTDPKVTVTGGPITLSAGVVDRTTFSAIYTITASDVQVGSVSNQAKVEGTDPNGNKVTDLSDGSTLAGDNPTVTPLAGGAIAIVKTGTLVDANNDGIKGNAGDKINYSFVVTNTGTVTLTNITVTDPKVTVSGGSVTLAAGAVDRTTFTAVYTITASDVQVGSVSNQAKVEGTDPNGNKVTDLSDGSTLAGDNPTVTPLAGGAIAIVKTGTLVDANNDGIKGNAGDKINYSFVVTNTGTVTLTNVTVTDPKVTVSGGSVTLAAGAVDRTTFTAVYTITTADVQAGSVSNQAKVEGTDPNGNKVTDLSDGSTLAGDNPTVTPLAGGAIAIVKTGTLVDANNDGIKGNAGDKINYSFVVTNTGTVTLTNVTVTDPKVTVSGGSVTLAAGAVDRTTFTAVYTITTADVQAGSVSNQAKAEGTDPNGNKVTDLSDGSTLAGDNPTVTPLAGGAIAIVKTGTVVDSNGDGVKGNVGDKINYSFVVTNTGTVTLTNVTVTDPKVTVSGGPVTLVAGAVDRTTFTAIYTITAADVQAGSVSNQAKVEGTDPNGNKVTDLSDGSSNTTNNPTITPIAGGAIALIKTATIIDESGDGVKGNVGDIISYSFIVTNVGSVSLTNVIVTDPKVTVSGGPITLAAGAVDKTTFTAVYTITAADLLVGSVTNQAKVEGIDIAGNKVSDLSDNNSNTENDPTITDVNDVPIAVNDDVILPLDQILYGNVGDNDKLSEDGGNIWTLVKQPTKGTLVFNSDGSYTYTSLPDFSGDDTFTYKLCDADGECSEAVVTISVEDIIPDQVFTPNGDGQNDKYFIYGIDQYPSNKLTIFNRWGNIVYEKAGYLNDWDGYANVKKVGNEPLPVGTYYFLIQYGNNRHKTGFVYLKR